MKTRLLASIALLVAGTLLAAETGAPNNTKVADAVAKLQSAPNFSWTMTPKIPGLPFEIGVLKGRAEKDGYAVVSQQVGDLNAEAVFKGEAIVLKMDGEWQIPDPSDMRAAGTAGAFTRNGTPAAEAARLLKFVKELKAADNGLFTGDLTEEGVKDTLTFGPRRGANNQPPVKNAKGEVKFWLKDGALDKFESHVQGTIRFGGPDGEEHDVEITRTIAIQDVGTTKIDVPAQAKEKLEPKTATSSEKAKS